MSDFEAATDIERVEFTDVRGVISPDADHAGTTLEAAEAR